MTRGGCAIHAQIIDADAAGCGGHGCRSPGPGIESADRQCASRPCGTFASRNAFRNAELFSYSGDLSVDARLLFR